MMQLVEKGERLNYLEDEEEWNERNWHELLIEDRNKVTLVPCFSFSMVVKCIKRNPVVKV